MVNENIFIKTRVLQVKKIEIAKGNCRSKLHQIWHYYINENKTNNGDKFSKDTSSLFILKSIMCFWYLSRVHFYHDWIFYTIVCSHFEDIEILAWNLWFYSHLDSHSHRASQRTRRVTYQLLLRLGSSSHVEARIGGERTGQLAVVRVANNWEPRAAA